MSINNVRTYFQQFDLSDRIIEFSQSSATVELAALALGVEPQLIAKTLSFRTESAIILVVTAGDAKIDNAKYRHTFNCKARMLEVSEAKELIGHEVGGVCPFAIKDDVEVYLDISLKRFEYIYPAAGSHNSAIKLTNEELEKYSRAKAWVDVCKNWI